MFFDFSTEFAEIIKLFIEAVDVRVLVGVQGIAKTCFHLILVNFSEKFLTKFVREVCEVPLAIIIPCG